MADGFASNDFTAGSAEGKYNGTLEKANGQPAGDVNDLEIVDADGNAIPHGTGILKGCLIEYTKNGSTIVSCKRLATITVSQGSIADQFTLAHLRNLARSVVDDSGANNTVITISKG